MNLTPSAPHGLDPQTLELIPVDASWIEQRGSELEATEIPPVPLESWLRALEAWAQRWANASDPWRQELEPLLRASTGFSASMLSWGLDRCFEVWNRSTMQTLLEVDLGDPEVLRRFVPTVAGDARRAMAPRMLLQILAGNLPAPTVQSLMAALLIRCPTLMKSSSSEPHFLPALVRSLKAHLGEWLPPLVAASWPGGDHACLDAALRYADVVVAYGQDSTLRSVQARMHPPARLIARGHRVSMGYVAREALTRGRLDALADGMARDVAAWDQLGCLSSHVVVVEQGAELPVSTLTETLAIRSLPELAQMWPMGAPDPADAARIVQRRGVLAFTGSLIDGPWGAVAEVSDSSFEPSCLGRVLQIKAVEDVEAARRYLVPVRGHLQACALACGAEREEALSLALARIGVDRICRVGSLQRPPASWGGDGRPLVADLVRWVTREPLVPEQGCAGGATDS